MVFRVCIHVPQSTLRVRVSDCMSIDRIWERSERRRRRTRRKKKSHNTNALHRPTIYEMQSIVYRDDVCARLIISMQDRMWTKNQNENGKKINWDSRLHHLATIRRADSHTRRIGFDASGKKYKSFQWWTFSLLLGFLTVVSSSSSSIVIVRNIFSINKRKKKHIFRHSIELTVSYASHRLAHGLSSKSVDLDTVISVPHCVSLLVF